MAGNECEGGEQADRMKAVRDGEQSNLEAGRNKRAATITEVQGAMIRC